ncbi:hypothetical protein BDC45DRAFT_570543 [Circinella umbellata]|nr:hypothetical protein BDC45DRAFT_570543 [Circinella umbellata]
MNKGTDWFYQNKPKDWNLHSAYFVYDQLEQFDSFIALIKKVHVDLVIVGQKQPLFKKFVVAKLQILEQQEQPQKTREKEQEDAKLPYAISIEKLTNNFTNNGEFNNVNKKIDLVYSQELQKKLVQERVNVNKLSGPLVESVITARPSHH